MPEDPLTPAQSGIDTTVPHSARIWNYWLGGKDHYEVDRQAGEAWLEQQPNGRDLARASRAFLGRAVTHLVREAGIRQFLDVGTGLPTAENTHEVAQRAAPEAKIVYVDNDPLVLAHARALLTSTPEGVTRYIHADMRQTDALLAEARETLDFSQPIALMLLGVLGHIADYDEARGLVRALVEPLAPGSYLVINDGSDDQDAIKAAREYAATGAIAYHIRDESEVAGFFPDGMELVEPGLVLVNDWRPEDVEGLEEVTPIRGEAPVRPRVSYFAGVARKV
jgi:O-methyltransferase involved in polyketide biosynthesis